MIGSEKGEDDILPRTDVSFNNGYTASLDNGVLYINNEPYTNVSEVIALVDAVPEEEVGVLSFEPGRVFYHTLELCNHAHQCVASNPIPSIVIRKLMIPPLKNHPTHYRLR